MASGVRIISLISSSIRQGMSSFLIGLIKSFKSRIRKIFLMFFLDPKMIMELFGLVRLGRMIMIMSLMEWSGIVLGWNKEVDRATYFRILRIIKVSCRFLLLELNSELLLINNRKLKLNKIVMIRHLFLKKIAQKQKDV